MSNVQKEVYVEGLGKIFYCNDSAFDDASEAVLKKSDGLISLKELAYARIQEGKDSSVSQNGSYVKEGSLFVPKAYNKRIWLRESLVLQNPSLAVNAHSKSNEYLLSKDFNVNSHLEKIGKDNYFVVSDTNPVPTNRFGEDELAVWAFQDQAGEYGKFLDGAGIKYLNILMHTDNDSYIDGRNGPFANQLWLHRLDNGSDIDGDSGGLYGNGRVRGVSRIVGADAPKKSMIETYTHKEMQTFVKKALHKEGITGTLEKRIISNLRK